MQQETNRAFTSVSAGCSSSAFLSFESWNMEQEKNA